MKGISPEQLFLLAVVILVMLANLIARWVKSRMEGAPPREASPAEPDLPRRAPLPPRVRVVEPPWPQEGPRSAPLPAPPRHPRG